MERRGVVLHTVQRTRTRGALVDVVSDPAWLGVRQARRVLQRGDGDVSGGHGEQFNLRDATREAAALGGRGSYQAGVLRSREASGLGS
jgi:hypothetical protein